MKNTDYEKHRQLAVYALQIASDEEEVGSDMERYQLARAHVHATLALAAATKGADTVVTYREDRA